jgi:hypothetical protein
MEGNESIGSDPVKTEQSGDVGYSESETESEMVQAGLFHVGESGGYEKQGSTDHVELDDSVNTTEGHHDQVKLEAADNGTIVCDPDQMDSTGHIKAEPLDSVGTEECGYTGTGKHDNADTNLCGYAVMVQHGDIPIKIETGDQIEADPWDHTGTVDNIPIKSEPCDRIETDPADQEETEESKFVSNEAKIKREPGVSDHVKYETESDNTLFSESQPRVYVFPPETVETDSMDFKQEEQQIAGLNRVKVEVNAFGVDPQVSDYVGPCPGQLPIHVIDPLHGDAMKMEEDASSDITDMTDVSIQLCDFW